MQKVRTRTFWTVLLAIAMLFSLAMPAQAAVPDGATQTVDSDSMYSYREGQAPLADSNQNAGRIWTDKSVFTGDYTLQSDDDAEDPVDNVTVNMDSEGADFLVALSALSSTQATSTSQTSGPMDILLVLDRSGSMAYNISTSDTYTATYSPRENGSTQYYALVGDQYVQIERVRRLTWGGRVFDHWELNGQEVEPMQYAGDTTSGRIQFYTYQRETISKEEAMKQAIDNFIDVVAAANKNADGTAKPEAEQHRVAVVSYADSARVDSDFTPVTGTNVQNLKDSVDGLRMTGGTYASKGMDAAETVMNGGTYGYTRYTGARQDANKILIYFTDGEPGDGGSTDPDEAGPALNTAHDLKTNSGVTIYSIGVMDDANPNRTDTMNAYMNGISSNYPDATWETNRFGTAYVSDPTLGDRVPMDEQYYLATQNSDELSQIFEDIFNEQNAANDPTLVTGGDAAHSGYITFTDTLGDFMEVKGFEAVVFNGVQYNNVSESTDPDTNVTTYTFSSDNIDSGNHNDTTLASLVIEVQHSANLQDGDVVTVSIPASLIPVRQYEVTTVNSSTGLKIVKKMPIRVFYSVGLKDEISNLYAGTASADQAKEAREALETYGTKDSNGNYQFYSNEYTGGTNGDTTVTFQPNTTNEFYYFTENTQLFSDEQGTAYSGGQPTGTLYYQHTYYTKTGTATQSTTEYLPIDCSVYDSSRFTQQDGKWYVLAETPKFDRSAHYVAEKGENNTNTATNAISPSWDANSANQTVTVALGNNGLITAPAPKGNLAISKTVTKADTSLTPDADQTFSFQIQFTGVPAGDYTYTVGTDTTEHTLTVGADGTATLSGLKATQTATIQGLPAGAGYTVTEDSVDGYTQTAPANGASATGSILAGKTATAAFTNEYSADDVTLSGDNLIKVSKTFTGPAGVTKTGDFTFTISANDNAPLPNDHELTLTGVTMNGNAATVGTFGAITYSKPGTYTYTIAETEGTDAGVTYDTNTRTVTVKVKDDGLGKLAIESVDYGNNATAAAFENTYEAEDATLSGETDLKVSKTIDGRGWLNDDAFTFTLTPDDASYPMPASNKVTLDKEHHSGNFGDITYDTADTYTYTITEDDLAAGSDLTKDTSEYTVTVVVSDDGNGVLKADATITNADGDEVPEAAFSNKYTGNDEPTKEVQTNGRDAENTLVGVGDVLTYTVHWTNTAVDDKGDAAAATVKVTDQIPAGTELVAGSISENGVESNGTITWTINAAAHQSGDVSFQVRVTEDAAKVDEISNKAVVAIGNNNPETTNEVVNNFPKKEETTKPSEIQVGQDLHYTITFKADSANIAVIDELSQGLEYKTGTATLNGTANEPTVSGQQLTWNLTGLTVGQQYTVAFDVTVTDAALTHVDNKATVGGHKSNTVPTPVDTGDSAKHVADATGANIDGKLVAVGDELTYSIDWVNDIASGNGTVTVTDELPTGLENPTAISDGGEYNEQTNTITWTYENQAAGQRGTASFKATVSADAPALLRNTASVNGTDVSVDNYVDTKTVTEPEGGVQVGSVLTYTINYANHTDAAATVTVTDNLSDGLDYVAGSAKVNGTATEPQGADTGDLVWTIENVAAHDTGTITFEAKVNEQAVTVGADNKATVKVGDDEAVDTNTIETDLGTGKLTIHKDVVVDASQGLEVDADKAFTFTVSLKDAQNNDLTGTYTYTGATTGTIANGGTLTLSNGQEVTIEGLPAGTRYEVTETQESGYTTTSTGEKGVIAENAMASAVFTNTYKVTETTIGGEGDTSLTVTKNLIGRDWTDDDSFEFTLTAQSDNAKEVLPNPESVTITNSSADHKAAFEAITFKKVGEYVFTVEEVVPADADENNTLNGITYDAEPRTLTIDVTDTGDGTLAAAVNAQKSGALNFTNTYDANFPENPDGSSDDALVQIPVRKEISGDRKAMLDGESYDFTVTPDTDKTTVNDTLIPGATQDKLTLNADKPEDLFSIDFSKLHETAEALLVRAQSGDESTVVPEQPAEDIVENEQPAEEPAEEATDTETEETTAPSEDVANAAKLAVATAETAEPAVTEPEEETVPSAEPVTEKALPNVATLSLAEIETLDADQAATLLDQICGDYYYTVSESTEQDAMRGGMTKDQSVYQVKVTLSHDGKGTLVLSDPEITKIVDENGNAIAAADQTKAEKALFTNVYTLNNSETTATISGTKVLNGRTLKEGEFTFRLQDANDETKLVEVTNAADGTFSFTMQYDKSQAGQTFYYTVQEVRGTNSTITYDDTVYRVKVDVVDDGNGTLSAVVTPLDGEVAFTNTYKAPAKQEETTTPAATPTPTPAPTATPEPQVSAATVPQTGDSFPYMLFVVLACVAVAGLCVSFYAKKRKQH